MYNLDFDKPVHVHFIGIGGISMSGLAEILLDKGFTVSGSDSSESELTDRLSDMGANIHYGQRAENITGDIDVVVYTAAIRPENPEFAAAVAAGLPMLTRAELLGQLMRSYATSVAVSGTHGKTTTTSMLSHIFLAADTDPTISVGGILPAIGGNIRVGGHKLFITEACEYTNSFLSFFPTMGLILNVDADHLDFFGTIENVRKSFRAFAELLPDDGTLIICSDIPDYTYFTEGLACKVITFSMDGIADYTADDIFYDEYAHPRFTLLYKGENIGRYHLAVPGRHNISNAIAAIAAARALGISDAAIHAGLAGFSGTERRFQTKGHVHGFEIVDDYAHHPTEINATLAAAAKYPHKKMWVIFQPHTYTRTKSLMPQFAKELTAADEVILADIYAAREKDDLGISSKDVADRVAMLGTPSHYFKTFREIEDFIIENAAEGDLVLTVGAGNVYEIGEHLLDRYGED